MAQSSNSLNETSVDDLLASIRDIIEENAGLALPEEGYAGHENSGSFAKEEPSVSYRGSAPDSSPSRKQDIHLAPRNNNVPPVQDAMNALAERIGLRKKEAMAGRSDALIKSSPVSGASPSQMQQRTNFIKEMNKLDMSKLASKAVPPKQKRPVDSGAEVNDGDKNFRNDVERSVEILLRPYIAQWLDVHFRQLFEKVLREEIQRFIQALQR